MLEHARDRLVGSAEVLAVDHQRGRRVRPERERRGGDVGQDDRVAYEQLLGAGHTVLLEIADEVVAVIERLVEGIADALPLAVANAVPGAVLAFDGAPLDLQAQDRLLGMAQHEVDLAVDRSLGVVAGDPAHRVIGAPVV